MKALSTKLESITLLGSTGSIGQSACAVIKANPHRFKVLGLSCQTNLETLEGQIRSFTPPLVAVGQGEKKALNERLFGFSKKPEILEGIEGYKKLASFEQGGKLLAAFVGAGGIEPVIHGIKAQKTLLLANKESIVLAGPLLTDLAKKQGVEILPVDSEHNAIYQALAGNHKELSHVILTASGGPFHSIPKSKFASLTKQQALKHPNWEMGAKITIDSATMMNKCLEIIEAKWLFDLEPSQIKVVIHPESIIHSMVTFKDSSSIAQMGLPDMRTPISYCLGWPERIQSGVQPLDLAKIGQLNFIEPDFNKFTSLKLAFEALELGDGVPAALNGANEVLVEQFLAETIGFDQIFSTLEALIEEIKRIKSLTERRDKEFLFTHDNLEQALAADAWGRTFALAKG